MNKKKLILKVLELTVYVIVGFYIYDKLQGNLSEIDFTTLNLTWILLAVLLFAIHTLINAHNWHFLMTRSGEKSTLNDQVGVYLRSYMMRYIPGNVVGIMGRALLNKEFGVPMVKSLWGWFLENIIYLGIGVLIGSYAILRGSAIDSQIIFIAMILTIIVGALLVFKNDFLEYIFNRFLVPKVRKMRNSLSKDIVPLEISLQDRINLSIRYLISWGVYSMSFLFVVSATGISVQNQIILLVSTNALAYSAGYLSIITPSGAGVREGVMIAMLTVVVGLSSSTSVIIAITARIVFILGELLSILFYYIARFFFFRINESN